MERQRKSQAILNAIPSVNCVCLVYPWILLSLPNFPMFRVPHPPVLFRVVCQFSAVGFLFELFPSHSGSVRVERKKGKKMTALLIRQVCFESLCTVGSVAGQVFGVFLCVVVVPPPSPPPPAASHPPPPPPPPPPPLLNDVLCRFLNHALFLHFSLLLFVCVCVCACVFVCPHWRLPKMVAVSIAVSSSGSVCRDGSCMCFTFFFSVFLETLTWGPPCFNMR